MISLFEMFGPDAVTLVCLRIVRVVVSAKVIVVLYLVLVLHCTLSFEVESDGGLVFVGS